MDFQTKEHRPRTEKTSYCLSGARDRVENDFFKATFGKCLKEVRRFLNKDKTHSRIVELTFKSSLTAERVILQRNIKIGRLSLQTFRNINKRKAYFDHVCK